MPATMRDVAQRAGVSIKTVSRVVNEQGEISDQTRRRVLAAIDELGYRPSRLARALVTQRTNTIGLVVGDITNPFFPEVARGIVDTARSADYHLFLCDSDGNLAQELSILQSLADHGVDGIILYPSYDSEANLKTFVQHYRPLVVVNYDFFHPGVSQIMVDHERGARLAVDHLVRQGHTAIGMLTGVRQPSFDRVRRVQGFREALADQGLPVRKEWIMPGTEPTFECGRRTALELLSQKPRATAIFAYNDLLALGALNACQELGLRVPEDCAIVGFDDIALAGMVTPALTSVRVDKYELGQQAMQRILAMLENPGETFSSVCMGVELVVRSST